MDDRITSLLEEEAVLALADAGQWDEIYKEAEKRKIEAYNLTKYLWESHIHPENEGLKRIPKRFASGLKV